MFFGCLFVKKEKKKNLTLAYELFKHEANSHNWDNYLKNVSNVFLNNLRKLGG